MQWWNRMIRHQGAIEGFDCANLGPAGSGFSLGHLICSPSPATGATAWFNLF